MGEHDMLCKHMMALAIAVLEKTGMLATESPPQNLAEVKKQVSEGVKKLRPYSGSSRTWFSYQRALATGAGTITEAATALPATRENAEYCWKLVLRLSKKLAGGGIDDSDCIVGGCVSSIVEQLAEYARIDLRLLLQIRGYCDDETGF